jgi:proton glutamate symport protein
MTKKHKRPWGVFIAIILAAAFGSWVGKDASLFGISLYSVFDTLGNVFLNALRLVVVPLVTSSIITGISKVGSESDFGRLGAKTFTFYLGTSLLAILIGLSYVNLIKPGVGFAGAEGAAIPGAEHLHIMEGLSSHDSTHPIVNVLYQLVPSNIVDALGKGQMLGIIFFALLFGFAISRIDAGPSSVLQRFFQGIFQAMIRVTHVIMRFLPYGVFCLITKVFMTTGLASISSVALFALTVLLGLGTFMFIGLPALLLFIGKVKPSRHFKAMGPAIVTAFSTSSSSATLPITIDCVEKRAGVSNRICSLVVPLGTSINMSGSALYECVAAMFIAQVYGIEISFFTQFLVVFMALITSIGVAGIPSASLVAVLVILKVMGLPEEGIGFFIAVDRLLDMCRSTVNIFSDSCCAVLVARTEGEKNVLAKDVSPSFDTD